MELCFFQSWKAQLVFLLILISFDTKKQQSRQTPFVVFPSSKETHNKIANSGFHSVKYGENLGLSQGQPGFVLGTQTRFVPGAVRGRPKGN